MKRFDIYETVTNLIVDRLEAGVVPWHMPWKTSSSIPRNLVSKKPYRGFNFWYLLSFGFERPYFLTFNQAKNLGASVKKGSKSHMVIFWKMFEVEKMAKRKKYQCFDIIVYFILMILKGLTRIKFRRTKVTIMNLIPSHLVSS
jgi:antirestriction protein ArdC